MKAKIYRGRRDDPNYPEYYVYADSNIDMSEEVDDLGNKLEFVCEEEISGEIDSFSPFSAEYKSYTGEMKKVIFRCPECGDNSCERTNPLLSDPHFFQGDFICSKCGCGPFVYCDKCFYNILK